MSGKAYGMEEDALGGGGGIISGGLKIGGKVEVGGLRLKKSEDTPLHGSRVSLKILNCNWLIILRYSLTERGALPGLICP